nr:hypothetical protein [Tanacetum cinerariifolium]
MELWVELKRMYELDLEDQLWTLTQNFMHAHVEWKLYDLSGVHHVTTKDNEIFMLVEKDYPLRKILALVMISYKLQRVLDTCSALALRVEGLENDKAAQQLEIVKLKARVKKLEKINKGRMIVDMDQDEGIELVTAQEKDVEGRMIVDMDHDEGIELVTAQEKDVEVEGMHADKQAEIYNIDLDYSSKVLSMQEDDTEVQEAVKVVTTAKLMTEVVTAAATQVVAASIPIPTAKPKTLTITAAPAVSTRRRKGVV